MPIRYEIDKQNRIVQTTFSGSVTYRIVADHALRLGEDHAFDPAFSEIIIFEDVSQIRLNYEDFEALLKVDPFSRSSRRAFVIPERGAVYGVTRIYQAARRDSPSVRIFETLAQALLWLTSEVSRPASA